jgi:DNA gyrase subunit B
MAKNQYDANSIEVLEFPDDVRKRPGMYIGGTTSEGMHHTYKEILDNAVDEAVAKHCKQIVVKNEGDGFLSVIDNGRGIPTGINKAKGVSALELVFTVLHAGGKFNNDGDSGGYKTSGGLHGVGASVTNAVSESLEVFVKRDDKTWTQNYERGIKQSEVKKTKKCDVEWIGKTGTYVRFKPDNQVFKHIDIVWDYNRIIRRCREIAFLVPGLQIDVVGWDDEDTPDISFKYDNGLHDYVDYQLSGKEAMVETIDLKVDLPDIGCSAQAVFAYETQFEEHLSTFANNIPTYEGGVHQNAFLNALLKVVTEIGEREKITKDFGGKVRKSDILEGLHGVILVRLQQPEFEGQTKTKLGNPEIRTPLEEQFIEQLSKLFERKLKKEGKLIAEKILQSVIARENARKAKELTRKKGGLEHFTLKGKLADCESKDPEECELFLVEGDSAGGSAKQGRNNRFQAILPLRGKVRNVEKTTINRAMENKELQALISALNVTPQANGVVPDADDIRFHNVVMLADADPDGAHITCLLIAFFYKFMRTLIERGHIYVAQPPLYKVRRGKNVFYILNDEELDDLKKKYKSDSLEISRFKGLGEMNPEQLAETVLNPSTRSLVQISIEDAEQAAKTIDDLLGKDVEGRRKFLSKDLNLTPASSIS